MTAVELKPAVDTAKLLNEFVEDCKVRHLTDETIGRYKSPLKLFFAFLDKRGRTVLDVDKFVLKDFIQFRRAQDIDQKTIENNFTALSTFYEFLCFEGHTDSNPVLPVRKRYLKRYKDDDDGGDSFDESARKLATVEQMGMLVNSILSVRDQAVVLTLAKTGLRRGELASIDIEDDNDGTGNINWVEQSITLKRKKFKKRSGRSVFFDDETARVLNSRSKFRHSAGYRGFHPECMQLLHK